MKFPYDLHIHSVLSPCADDLMTPNNIFNMANLKGLKVIAVTDHNSTKQLSICHELSESYDMLFVPGVEITLEDGVHVLCYFRRLEDAITFDHTLEACNKKRAYDPMVFGTQDITDIHDEIIDTVPYALTDPLSLSLLRLKEALKDIDHILVYAHVDRPSHSGLKYVKSCPLDAIEVTKGCNDAFLIEHEIDTFKILRNSDAHIITDISESKGNPMIDLEDLTIDAFFKEFHHG